MDSHLIFHLLMARDGREFSWETGFYWTLTTMSTLGYGDITFTTGIGHLFSMIVLLTGMGSLLVVLPFTFIQFFYEPWMQAHSAARVPKELPKGTKGHIVLTHFNIVTKTLINKLNQYHYPYVLLLPNLKEGLNLFDNGYRVVVGKLDEPETYRKIRIEKAALVATTADDITNTNVAFTVRELTKSVPIITTANKEASVDILKLAGANHVLKLGEMMGQSLVRRTNAGDVMAHVIGQFGDVYISEATVAGQMVGKTIEEMKFRELIGITILGVWERGKFEAVQPDTIINKSTVLVLAGTKKQLEKYNEIFCIYGVASGPVIIIGGGRVGRAAGRALAARDLDYRIIDSNPARIRNKEKYLLGDAADLKVLEKAGIMESPAVIITSHDESTNVYLNIYLRRLRPDIQIISRGGMESNISSLHRAGSDFVMSYASMGANTIFNFLKKGDILMVAEGLNVFRLDLPPTLAGKSIAEMAVRKNTGCTIISVVKNKQASIPPDPHQPLPDQGEIILIGSVDAEDKFLKLYGNG